LLLSEERVSVPEDSLVLTTVKTRYKMRGLISVSGFHVDPGFVGRLIFSVYNAGTSDVVINRGDRVFLLWFASLDSPTGDTYTGNRRNQASIPSNDIMALGEEPFSPVAVGRRVKDLESRVDRAVNTAKALLIGVVLVLAAWLLSRGDVAEMPNVPTPSITPAA
jgi:dCTP deaminase